ncbi:MAG TPA: Rad52/Rad22 family DNA repair protein [Blastocatellia bacterium]|nr:Rad52/Rad22 family DNA repair protein [Blastocatellia bacterium]
MTNTSDQLQEVNAPADGPRSIKDIVADLSKPVNPKRLKQRQQGGRTLDYLPWYQAVRYLDNYAPGWRYEIRSVNQIGDNLVMTVRITIPCLEGEVWREASALEKIEDAKRYGDAATNAESAALRRAAAKFGLCLNLYDK